MTDLDTLVGKPADSVRVIELDDDLSVFDAATGSALALNRTAADVFALADGSTSLGDIVRTLATAYQVDPGTIEEDVRAVVVRLTEAGAIVPAQ